VEECETKYKEECTKVPHHHCKTVQEQVGGSAVQCCSAVQCSAGNLI
jgi:hypothetical protein